LNKANSNKQSTQNSILIKSNRNTGINKHFSIITLNVNGLNSQVKRQIVRLDQKPGFNNLCSTETYLTTKDTHKLKVKGWIKFYQACRNWEQTGKAVLISDTADFMQKSVRRNKGHYMLIKGTIQQKDIKILNLYPLNIRVPIFINKHFWA
jgi:exonuclease III